MTSKAVFLFTRDLRLHDNTSLLTLEKRGMPWLPLFILNPRQLDPKQNPYRSEAAVQFMMESLRDLQLQVKKHNTSLVLDYGEPTECLTRLFHSHPFQLLAWNKDLTPFSQQRDATLIQWCKEHDVDFLHEEDYTLFPLGSIEAPSSKAMYKKFTPFYQAVYKQSVLKSRPLANPQTWKASSPIPIKDLNHFYEENRRLSVHGGRSYGLIQMGQLSKLQHYDEERDTPSIPTSTMSAYLKFGCISIREFREEVLKLFGISHGLYKQCYWREFYAQIAYAYPHVFRRAFKPSYDHIKWENNKAWFEAWKEGRTGCPFVDAGMRQLNQTGFMHNRLRMVVSMFLTKDLLIDWRWGEQYFASRLVDYDPAQNNGGWQWSASTGTDSQPYFRIFNPYTMGKRLDPVAKYIKQWIPELASISAADIHNWEQRHSQYPKVYVAPIVNHAIQRQKALDMYSKV